MTSFGVHYGGLVKTMTTVVGVLLLAVFAAGLMHVGDGAIRPVLMIALPPALLIAVALFAVLRYELDDRGLHVVRPIGRLRIASAATAVAADDDALKGAIRTFGNGGLFAFTGWYRLPRYGRCRLWVTDLHRLVVIRGDRGCVVVSPAQRDAFMAAAKTRFGVAP